MKRSARGLAAVAAICCLAGISGLLAAVAGADDHGTAATDSMSGTADGVLTVGGRGCAPGVGDVRSGRQSFRIRNTGASPEEVTVLDGDHRYAYGELEMIAPGTTLELVVVLPPGTFSLGCEADDGTVGYSDPITVSGPKVSGVHRWIPATYGDLSNAVTNYRRSVAAGLDVLAADTDKLLAAARSKDRPETERRWLTAHLGYERLGAAYDTFGDFADAIDGRPDGLPKGVDDPDFTGFHRLEYALWHGRSDAEVLKIARKLDQDVHGLVKDFPHEITAPNDVGLRTHEILENTLQFELTGDTDQGSHTNLATMAANIDGTRMTLAAITPVLQQNDPELLASAQTALDRLSTTVQKYHRKDAWTPLSELSTSQRRQLDGTLADTLEKLAPIPTELEVLTTRENG